MDEFPSARRSSLLLKLSDALIQAHDLTGLVDALKTAMRPVTASDFFVLTIHDKSNDRVSAHVFDAQGGEHSSVDLNVPMLADTSVGESIETGQPVVVGDWQTETRFASSRDIVLGYGARSSATLPLITARGALGGMGFYSRWAGAYADSREVGVLAKVASQVAIAVENVLHREHAERLRAELQSERDRLRLLLELTNITITQRELSGVFLEFCRRLQPELDLRIAWLAVCLPTHDKRERLVLYAKHPEEGLGDGPSLGQTLEPNNSIAALAVQSRDAIVLNTAELAQSKIEGARWLMSKGVGSVCSVPLLVADRVVGALSAGTDRDHAFDQPDAINLLRQAAAQCAIAVDNALAFQQIRELTARLSQEKLYLEEEVRSEGGFDEIIGRSDATRRVLAQAGVVAPTSATALIYGETGTGKELVARAIHRLSPRHDRTFVKLNCAAIPATLLESELFGHEKGAFTGATAQRAGRFELADGGTLFLDEIGDLPSELQPKLLRVLQEQEFERVGGMRTIKTDVRVVAATNRDLRAMVASREFREDLYYRLNVFPIVLASLRDRREDIPMLVAHFVRRFATKAHRQIDGLQPGAMEAMQRYSWPGNVRELQNFIERAVILSRGTVLEPPLVELREPVAPLEEPIREVVPDVTARGPASPAITSLAQSVGSSSLDPGDNLDDLQRGHILQVLRDVRWVIGGPDGAAARLGMKRTTLQSKMRKLGIARPV